MAALCWCMFRPRPAVVVPVVLLQDDDGARTSKSRALAVAALLQELVVDAATGTLLVAAAGLPFLAATPTAPEEQPKTDEARTDQDATHVDAEAAEAQGVQAPPHQAEDQDTAAAAPAASQPAGVQGPTLSEETAVHLTITDRVNFRLRLSKDDLLKLFSNYGTVEHIKVDDAGANSMITFLSSEAAHAAVAALDGTVLNQGEGTLRLTCANAWSTPPPSPQVHRMPLAASGATASGDDSLPLSKLFSVGDKLGAGTFGVVRTCSRRCDGHEFAVKLIDKLAVKPADVRKEAQMLESLAHPNIVSFHGLFPEGTCLCIVMEKLSGGTLNDGIQTHLNKWGSIDGQKVIGAVRQMTSSIQYLHHRLVVHRDVKWDNILMDRPDILDPECRLVLTDFGWACRLERPGERLSTWAGTFYFLSPELLDGNYSAKVDVWALGVVMYGLATDRYPFQNEVEIRNKRITIPGTVRPPFRDFIGSMLRKDEATRLDSSQAMRHPYLNPDGGAPTPA